MIYKIPAADVLSLTLIAIIGGESYWNIALNCGAIISASVIAADGNEIAFSTSGELTCCEKHRACRVEKEET